MKRHEEKLKEVGRTGFEPVTSALSRQRSKPTELTSRERQIYYIFNYEEKILFMVYYVVVELFCKPHQ